MSKNQSVVKIHPASVKHLKNGHPWVTKDKFSLNFPKEQKFLSALDAKGKVFCHLLNDPEHKNVKARLWDFSDISVLGERKFKETLNDRLYKSVKSRKTMQILRERRNLYLAFGEADHLPGLFVQLFDQVILISYYSNFWSRYINSISERVKSLAKELLKVDVIASYSQQRDHKQQSSPVKIFGKTPHNYAITEFGVKYLVKFEEEYDQGLYSDMASIRKTLAPYFKQSENLLNLYSYTGAYSLFPLKCGANHVTSVDISKKYMTRLEDNLLLNRMPNESHSSVVKPTIKALDKFIKEEKYFDFIICDPPTSSSDGKKKTSVLKNYEEIVTKLVNVTAPEGFLLLFNNTHQDNWEKFERVVTEQINTLTSYQVIQRFHLSEDCPTIKNFDEGNYLKGILIKVKF